MALQFDQRVTDLLQKQGAMRVAVFLRSKSPLYSLGNDEVVISACRTLGIDPVASRARLMTILEWDYLTIFAFNLWFDDCDWATAHHKLGSQGFRDKVNDLVASQHDRHGWDAKPPYLEDHTLPGV